jgi:hypothetical protein
VRLLEPLTDREVQLGRDHPRPWLGDAYFFYFIFNTIVKLSTHTYTYPTHTHTLSHTRTHTHTQSHTITRRHIHTYTHTHTITHTHTHTHTHTQSHTRTGARETQGWFWEFVNQSGVTLSEGGNMSYQVLIFLIKKSVVLGVLSREL